MGQQKELVRVIDVEYDASDELHINLIARSERGRRVHKKIYGIEPYLFIPEESPDPTGIRRLAQYVDRVEEGYEAYDGSPVKKVVTHIPKYVPKVSKEYQIAYEDDIPFERRCTADYDLSGYVRVPVDQNINIDEVESVRKRDVQEIEPRTLMIDIETRVPDDFNQDFIDDAPNEVTAITTYDTYADKYTLYALDPDNQVDPTEIRGYIYENWDGEPPEDVQDIDIQYLEFGEEPALLERFSKDVAKTTPDVMTGWNYINFDHEYLHNRMRRLDKVNPHRMSSIGGVGGYMTERYVTGSPAIDMMEAFCEKLSYGEWESKSLDYVASEVVGVGKVEGDDVAFDKNRTKFMAYNLVDVLLLEKIDELRGVISFWFMIAEVCAIPSYSVGSTMKESEGYLFRKRNNTEILPSTEESDMDSISGGLVMPAFDGLEDWVGVLDLKSLYPSSMITCNISKETMTTDPEEADIIVPDMPLNYEEVTGNSITREDIGWQLGEGACVGFNTDKQGIVPKYLEELFSNRAELKSLRDQYDPDESEYKRYDQQQRAVKVVMNSFFGVSDNPYFRLSADGLGAAITSVSRFVSWAGIQAIEDQGYNVRYGDTDSLMVSLTDKPGLEGSEIDEFVNALEKLEEDVNEQIGFVADEIGITGENRFVSDLHGTERHAWVYEAEKLYRRFLQTGSKKRYAGWTKWKEGKFVDDVGVTGYELVRADASTVTEEVQTEFIRMVLQEEPFENLTEFIQNEIRKLEEQERPVKEYGIPSSINKALEEYPNRPTKRAGMYSNKHLGYDWGSGDNPWLVYVSDCPFDLPNTDVIAVSWSDQQLPDGFEVDVEEHTDKMIRGPIEPIMETVGYDWSEMKTGMRQQSLFGSDSGDSTPVFDESAETTDPFENID